MRIPFAGINAKRPVSEIGVDRRDWDQIANLIKRREAEKAPGGGRFHSLFANWFISALHDTPEKKARRALEGRPFDPMGKDNWYLGPRRRDTELLRAARIKLERGLVASRAIVDRAGGEQAYAEEQLARSALGRPFAQASRAAELFRPEQAGAGGGGRGSGSTVGSPRPAPAERRARRSAAPMRPKRRARVSAIRALREPLGATGGGAGGYSAREILG